MNAQNTSGQKTVSPGSRPSGRSLVATGLIALMALGVACSNRPAPTQEELSRANSDSLAQVERTTENIDSSSTLYGQLGPNSLLKGYEAAESTAQRVRTEAQRAGYLGR